MLKCYNLFLGLLAERIKPEDLKGEAEATLKMLYHLCRQHLENVDHYSDLRREYLTPEQWEYELTEKGIREKMLNDPLNDYYTAEQVLYALRILAYKDHPFSAVMEQNFTKIEFALFWAYIIRAGELHQKFKTDKQMWIELAGIAGGSPDKLRKDATKLYYQHNRIKIPDAKFRITKVAAFLFMMGFSGSTKLANSDLGAIQ